jgi:hypothetical protein
VYFQSYNTCVQTAWSELEREDINPKLVGYTSLGFLQVLQYIDLMYFLNERPKGQAFLSPRPGYMACRS